jgi:hypothetical protein
VSGHGTPNIVALIASPAPHLNNGCDDAEIQTSFRAEDFAATLLHTAPRGPLTVIDESAVHALDLAWSDFTVAMLNQTARTAQLAVLVLDDIAGARPYAAIAARQLDVAARDARGAARALSFAWRAEDLAVFAASRTNAPTIVATHSQDPGRQQLVDASFLLIE